MFLAGELRSLFSLGHSKSVCAPSYHCMICQLICQPGDFLSIELQRMCAGLNTQSKGENKGVKILFSDGPNDKSHRVVSYITLNELGVQRRAGWKDSFCLGSRDTEKVSRAPVFDVGL